MVIRNKSGIAVARTPAERLSPHRIHFWIALFVIACVDRVAGWTIDPAERQQYAIAPGVVAAY